MNGDISGATAGAYKVMLPLDIVSYLIAWALAIIARIQYKNKFSLVLIILYGSLLALGVIGVLLFLIVFLGIL